MKMKFSFFAETKQQVDQIKRKIVANFNKPLFFQKTHIFGSFKRNKIPYFGTAWESK